MRQGVLYAPSPSINPTSAAATAQTNNQGMLLSVFLALFLPCAGMSALFVVYICLLWFASNPPINPIVTGRDDVKPAAKKGLSAAELEKLPKVTGKELSMGNECAVCLDEIEEEQPARQIPVCKHGFHLECADKWLSDHPFCPVCRGKIDRDRLQNPGGYDDSPC
ncbi:E3 ubiquitin-protein ligase ATL23 [Linum perenne]